MLEVNNLTVSYGSIQAIKGISLMVKEGEIVALIGSNGAGKSTALMTISGIIRPRSGSITFDGREIHRLAPERIVEAGISQVPEGRRIFPSLTVKENLEMGAFSRKGTDIAGAIEHIVEIFPILGERQYQHAGTLSGGEQQMLAIGRALMAKPRLLMLDEPSLGLAPVLVERIFETIASIKQSGTTILLVEQNANIALDIADRGYVLETGELVLEGTSSELISNELIKTAYLG